MDEAGLLNSMTAAELAVTCERMQRSCGDMEMLLNEFQMEQEVLIKEQDRLGMKIEKVSSQIERRKKDRGTLWNFLAEIQSTDERPDIAHILRRVEEREAAAKRRRKRSSWSTPERAEGKVADDKDSGPFSQASLKHSWGDEASAMRPFSLDDHTLQALRVWLQQSLCEDSVAEAERLSASAEMWMDHLTQFSATFEVPGDSPDEDDPSDVAEDAREDVLRSKTSPKTSPPPRAAARRATAPSFSEMPQTSPEGEDSRHPKSPVPRLQHRRSSENLGVDDGGLAAGVSAAAEKAQAKAEKVGGKILDWFGIDLPSGVPRETIVLTVTLSRTDNNEKWGLAWVKDRFNKHGERIVEKTVPNYVAGHWNQQQTDLGHSERCIRPQDRLISANGKTKPEAITAELKSKEVVLEFQRIVQKQSPGMPQREPAVDRPDPAVSSSVAELPAESGVPSSAAGEASAQAPASRAGGARPKFAAAFSAYVQAAKSVKQEDSPEAEDDTLPPLEDLDDEDDMLPPLESPSESPSDVQDTAAPTLGGAPFVAASVAAAVAAADEAEAEESTAELLGARAPRSEAPFSVVAQVLRLTKVSVQLSWLFDWEAAPELSADPCMSRSFVVLQRAEAAEGTGEVTRWPCGRSPISLDLPAGWRYVFEVQAVLLRIGDDASGASAPTPTLAWTSPTSLAVSADLRDVAPAPSRPPLLRAVSDASSSGSLPQDSSMVPALASSSTGPTAGLRGRPAPGAVAARLGAFLAQRPVGPSAATTPSGVSSEPVRVMGGSKEARSRLPPPSPTAAKVAETPPESSAPKAAHASAKVEENPLALSQPKVVAAGPFNPVVEKREVADRLRRRGNGQETGAAMPSQRSRVWRSDSVDSDDGMLQQLAQSMKKLE